MAIERVRRVGPYAPLSSTYYQDDAIAEAGEAAELLYLRGLAFCASRPEQDGFISTMQLARFVGVGMPDALERARRLVDVDLWEQVENGYVIRSWLRWNKSADELGRYRAKDRDRKRKTEDGSDDESESETVSDRIPSGLRAEGVSDSATASDTHITSLHITSPSSPPAPRPGAGDPKPGSDDDADWCKFWATYPRRVGKAEARKAWAKAIKGRHDPEKIISGASRYAAEVTRRRAPIDKIKHPQGWLTGERWNDDLATTTATSGAFWDN